VLWSTDDGATFVRIGGDELTNDTVSRLVYSNGVFICNPEPTLQRPRSRPMAATRPTGTPRARAGHELRRDLMSRKIVGDTGVGHSVTQIGGMNGIWYGTWCGRRGLSAKHRHLAIRSIRSSVAKIRNTHLWCEVHKADVNQ
jgi:hypothetical protein